MKCLRDGCNNEHRGRPPTGGGRPQKYCSAACRYKAFHRNDRKPLETKTCEDPECNNKFIPKNCQKFCSNYCRYHTRGLKRRKGTERYSGVNTIHKSIVLDGLTAVEISNYAVKQKQSFSAAVRDLLEWAIEDHVK